MKEWQAETRANAVANGFNPHSREGVATKPSIELISRNSFNPHSREGVAAAPDI